MRTQTRSDARAPERAHRPHRRKVADAVAPSDQPVWRARWAIETSWAMFSWLGLEDGNWVDVPAVAG